MKALALLLCLACASAAAAQDSRRIDRITAAWTGWLAENQIAVGTLALSYRGQVVHAAGQGRAADAPVELASVGKSLTAICLNALVDEGRARYDMTLGAVLGITGPLENVTLAQLVTHSAGIGPDSTQAAMWTWLGQTQSRYTDVTATVLARPTQLAAPGVYGYNNENYAVLGSVIAQLTGQTYRAACTDRVGAGYPTLRLSPVTGSFDAWGGWQMSVADYARFHAHHFGGDSRIGPIPDQFPSALISGGAYYGLGTFFRAFRDNWNFWHSGALCFDDVQHGSFAVSWEGGWGAVTVVDACLDFSQIITLDRALALAALGP
jgi:CubicO group peptidase (beta-lactamase class C family)